MSRLHKLIDVHSHAILDIGAGAPLAQQPDWSVEGAIALMDQSEISTAILSVPQAANDARGQQGRDIARRVNETLADMVAQHPKRFGAMASVLPHDIDGTLREMEYALDTLQLDGVATTTSIDDVYLGEALYDPWFEEMNRRRVTLFIHPTALRSYPETGLGLNASCFEFMFSSTRMLANMVITGAKQRFADMNMITTHAGGTMPFLVQRFQIVVDAFGPGPGRAPISSEEIRRVLASFHYDLTAATTDTQLLGLLDLVPVSQLLMGIDIPFMPHGTIAPAIEAVSNYSRFSQSDLDAIAHGNAARLYPALAARLGIAAG